MKIPFVTREQLESLTQEFPTPFHLYDEAGIRETARQIILALVEKRSCFLLTTRQLMNLSMLEN